MRKYSITVGGYVTGEISGLGAAANCPEPLITRNLHRRLEMTAQHHSTLKAWVPQPSRSVRSALKNNHEDNTAALL
jgi:hypothetical protein